MIGPNSSGRILAKLVSSVPATIDPATVRDRITAYYASYDPLDVAAREALFAPDCRFEDPAGNLVATDQASLHHFFTDVLPATWMISFRLDRVAVVGNEALATATMRLQADQRTPVEVVVNAHFAFTDTGLIRSARMFFDEAAITDLE
jgi:SnoaL-like protein